LGVVEARATKVNAAGLVTVPCVVTTVTPTVPAPWAAVLATRDVALFTVKLAAVVAPNLTFLVPVRWLPETVTVVPPVAGPELGATEETVGAGVTR